MALVNALERHGRELGDPECHPVVTARHAADCSAVP